MPLGFAVMLWAADIVPATPPDWQADHQVGTRPAIAPAMSLSAADLARTSRVMKRGQPAVARPGVVVADSQPAAQQPDNPFDLALLIGSRRGSGQVEMGALGGGRADAPGLVHIGIGLDF